MSTSGISSSFLGLSRSSGWVTHVLLTRSRLCPRPKPGSSLHLHVLSTPPAFVLSQDQTLREELLQRAVAHLTRARPYTRPLPDAIDEVCFRCRTTHECAAGVDEPGRIDLWPGARQGRSVRMLLSFQRPPRLVSGG